MSFFKYLAHTMGSTELMYIDFLKRLLRRRLLMHLLFWAAVLSFFNFVFRDRTVGHTLLVSLEFLPQHLIFVYALNYFLFPRYVLKGKILSAFIWLLVILAVALLFGRLADVYFVHYSQNRHIWAPGNLPRAIYALFSIGWIAVTIRLVKKWYIQQEDQHRLEKEKLTVELQLLRSQLHPHFLFNTLNSLYAMTMERSDEAPEAVLQLAALLRYILYECNAPLVPLDREIDSLRNYIQLEKMRFGDRLDISLSFTGDITGKNIAPLLFLPFVENSIKHGISEALENSWISLQLHVDGHSLFFKLINSRDPDASRPPRQPSGLGIANVRRRLALLYPGRHHLLLRPEEDTYIVSLTLTSRNYEPEMSVG